MSNCNTLMFLYLLDEIVSLIDYQTYNVNQVVHSFECTNYSIVSVCDSELIFLTDIRYMNGQNIHTSFPL